MDNIIQRTVTGTFLMLLFTAAIKWDQYSFILLMMLVTLFSLLEFYRLFSSNTISPDQAGGIVLSFILQASVIIVIMGITSWKVLLMNIPAAFGIFIHELYRDRRNPFRNLAFTFLGILFISIPICLFICIPFLPAQFGVYHFQIAIGYFLILWTHDSIAYLMGTVFGSRPLFKRISPGKTWEGSIGGAVFAIFASYLIGNYFNILSLRDWAIISCIIIVFGTFGDLIKSLMKRSLDIKDSGIILPGHGGMLDRFDSLLGSAPFVFCYLLLFTTP